MIRNVLALAVLALPLMAQGGAFAETAPIGTSFLRSEWSVQTTRAGRAHVVGYVYNSSIQNAANVGLRVERLGPGGQVTGAYRGRVFGDVLSGDRLVFDVAVPEAEATYRVLVDAVDWFMDRSCR